MHSDHISTFSLFVIGGYGKGKRSASHFSSAPTPTFLFVFKLKIWVTMGGTNLVDNCQNFQSWDHLASVSVLWGNIRGIEQGSLFWYAKGDDLLHKHFEGWRCTFVRGSQEKARGIHGKLHGWCFTGGFMVSFLACIILFYCCRFSCLCNVQV